MTGAGAHSPGMVEPQPGAALITGASRRIGRAIALDLAAAGWAVCVHYHRSGDAAREVCQAIEAGGGRAAMVAADLAVDAETEALIPRAAKALGPLTCLVNNAAVFEDDGLADATRESWDAHMNVNLRAPFVLTQNFARQMVPGGAGNIINIIDQRVWNLTPYFTSYTLSKAGLWILTQCLAQALAPDIRINAIGPGPTLPSARQTDGQFARQIAALPLARRADVEEICRAVRFILAQPSMTGQMIALDGGQHLGWSQPAGGAGPEE